jgi:glycosyltransferase involved in cell wall biosynthesis
MRIAQVVPSGAPSCSGVLVAIVQLSVHLARIGHDVEVWLLRPWGEEAARMYGRALAEAGVALVAPSTGGGGHAALAARDADVVHLHSVFTPPNALLARWLQAPYVVSSHGGYAPASLSRSAVRKTLYKHLVERRVLRRAALRVALTEVEAEELRSFGAGEPIAVIPNGVSPAPRDTDGRVVRDELGLDPTCRLLLFVGRLDVFHKGLDFLVEAVAAAPGWHLALAGPDFRGGGRWLLARVETLGVRPRVTLLGPRYGQALHQAYAAADLFALTSRWEGLPISLLEALSHATPALVTPAVDGVMGIAAAGAGWVADPHELGTVLQRLEGVRPEAWRRHAERARALAGRYDWTAVAHRYEVAYADVLAGSVR